MNQTEKAPRPIGRNNYNTRLQTLSLASVKLPSWDVVDVGGIKVADDVLKDARGIGELSRDVFGSDIPSLSLTMRRMLTSRQLRFLDVPKAHREVVWAIVGQMNHFYDKGYLRRRIAHLARKDKGGGFRLRWKALLVIDSELYTWMLRSVRRAFDVHLTIISILFRERRGKKHADIGYSGIPLTRESIYLTIDMLLWWTASSRSLDIPENVLVDVAAYRVRQKQSRCDDSEVEFIAGYDRLSKRQIYYLMGHNKWTFMIDAGIDHEIENYISTSLDYALLGLAFNTELGIGYSRQLPRFPAFAVREVAALHALSRLNTGVLPWLRHYVNEDTTRSEFGQVLYHAVREALGNEMALCWVVAIWHTGGLTPEEVFYYIPDDQNSAKYYARVAVRVAPVVKELDDLCATTEDKIAFVNEILRNIAPDRDISTLPEMIRNGISLDVASTMLPPASLD